MPITPELGQANLISLISTFFRVERIGLKILVKRLLSVMASWLLIQVKPRQEMRTLANIEVEKLVRGKRVKAAETLFPGYVFLIAKGCDSDDSCKTNSHFTCINIPSSRGVSKIVSFGGEPVSVSQSVIG